MQAEWIEHGDRRWVALLGQCAHDFHHLPAYLSLEAARQEGRAAGLWVEGSVDGRQERALLPLILRALPDGAPGLDAVSPYGYPGPLRSTHDPAFMSAAIQAWRAAMRERAVVCAFVRLHPLLDETFQDAEDTEDTEDVEGSIVERGPTVWIDLEAPEDEQFAAYRGMDRRLVRRALRNGAQVVIEPFPSPRFEAFHRVYAETMTRLGAPESGFDRPYLERLIELLGERGFLAFVEQDGEIAAAGLFTRCSGIIEYHFSGTADAWRSTGPTRLLIHEVRRHCAAAGDRVMHLGGGLGSQEDELLRFKRGFSKQRARFRTWQVVADRPAYAELCESWQQRGGDPASATGFFPLYRAPVESRESRA